MIRVQVVGSEKVAAALALMPQEVMNALETKMRSEMVDLAHYVVTQKLHGQVLHQRSGALARSIQSEARVSGMTVIGRVFSAGDVKYAGIHEYGGTIPAHDIVARKAKALSFILNGKATFAKSVHIPAVTMPERSFLRSSLKDNQERLVKAILNAAVRAARKVLGQ